MLLLYFVCVCGRDEDVPVIDVVDVKSEMFEKWSQKQVSNWVQSVLTKNEFDHKFIDAFIEEFDKKFINGKVLLKMKQKPELVDSLILQFSTEHQGFGIWVAIKSAIDDLKI